MRYEMILLPVVVTVTIIWSVEHVLGLDIKFDFPCVLQFGDREDIQSMIKKGNYEASGQADKSVGRVFITSCSPLLCL